ncbi:MAG: adenylate kinase [Phycisphaerae bacterium]|nr:adenylate kinase [Phycisphaerae bacterium]NIP53682.1 adenylate kinase [Phycisphaerae bacterium]NIS52605.1 adenylate kinase [Phycisphaerae bacterium]NIU10084.1 adenylate kinase [Phycisphaerae bacterium]NIV02678.1 adenylate kinase [Phycisphaerae bacterium]
MRIVLLGTPGAGKGTQCKRIVARYGLQHLSSGDILRQQRIEGTELGEAAQTYMDSGALVPDQIIVEMMVDAIKKAPDVGFILDGFPRTVNQATELSKSLTSANQKIDAVINLKIDDQVVFQRMAGRRSCPQCGAVYNIETIKPRIEGVCDNDGAKLIQRPDDSNEVVANRLETYHLQTEPVIDYYKKNSSTVYDFDANKDAEEVSALVFVKLDALADG